MSEPAFDRLLEILIERGIQFVLVGGLALGSWGVVRGTKDVDIVVDPDPDNLRALAEVVVELDGQVQTAGSFLSSFHAIAARLASRERVFIETRLGPLDVVQGLQGVPAYAELRERSVIASVLGREVAVCSLEDLRAMKGAAGRTRDRADLEDLDAAHGEA